MTSSVPRLWAAVVVLAVPLVGAGAVRAGADVPADSSPAVVEETAAGVGHSLLPDLQNYLRSRNIDADRLTVETAVALMIDWYREAPAAGDRLVFRYTGWSEGCATGFNVSLLRHGGLRGTAGVTLMFEPSGGADLEAFSTALSERQSIPAFLHAIEGSPAYRQYGTARPMGVALDGGGLR